MRRLCQEFLQEISWHLKAVNLSFPALSLSSAGRIVHISPIQRP